MNAPKNPEGKWWSCLGDSDEVDEGSAGVAADAAGGVWEGADDETHNLLRILCDTLARWLEAVSSTLAEMVTRARKLPGRQEVLPCCGEDVVDIEHWRLGGQHTQR